MELTNILLGILTITLCFYILIRLREGFTNSLPVPVASSTNEAVKNADKSIPAVDPKVIQSTITGIKNTIVNRPDVILSIKQVLADPTINSTLYDILSSLRPAGTKLN